MMDDDATTAGLGGVCALTSEGRSGRVG